MMSVQLLSVSLSLSLSLGQEKGDRRSLQTSLTYDGLFRHLSRLGKAAPHFGLFFLNSFSAAASTFDPGNSVLSSLQSTAQMLLLAPEAGGVWKLVQRPRRLETQPTCLMSASPAEHRGLWQTSASASALHRLVSSLPPLPLVLFSLPRVEITRSARGGDEVIAAYTRATGGSV